MMFRRQFSMGPWAVAAAFLVLLTLTLAGCLDLSRADERGGTGGSARVPGVDARTSDSDASVTDLSDAEGRETVRIDIRNFRFHPSDVQIRTGTRVVFANEDDVAHNIVQTSSHRVGVGPALFESPVLDTGQEWSFVFDKAGEYPIICTVGGHQLMGMQGRIVVSDE